MPVRMRMRAYPATTAAKRGANRRRSLRSRRAGALRIGLVNNMPDSAFKATERQFVSLLNAASDGASRLKLLFILCLASLGRSRTKRGMRA